MSQLEHVTLLLHVLQFGIVELHGAHTVFRPTTQGAAVNVPLGQRVHAVAVQMGSHDWCRTSKSYDIQHIIIQAFISCHV